MKETTVKHKTVYEGKIVQVYEDQVELCDGTKSTREFVHNNGGVGVLAFDTQGNIILVKQFRYPSKEVLYEIAAGRQEPGETYMETGMRELLEETGYHSDETSYFGYLYPTVAYADETIHLVVAKNCTYLKKQPDLGEFTETIILPMQDVVDMIYRNEIKDGKTIIAVLKFLCLQQYK